MNTPLGERKVHCQNCAWTGKEADTDDIDDFFERVDTTAGNLEIMPSGECPECGALCAIDDDELPRPSAEFQAREEALKIVAELAASDPVEISESDAVSSSDGEAAMEQLNDLVAHAQAFFKTHPALKITDYVP